MSWWWCLKHSRPEQDPDVDVAGEDKVGPYDSEDAARGWKDQFEARNEKWEREDREWQEGSSGGRRTHGSPASPDRGDPAGS